MRRAGFVSVAVLSLVSFVSVRQAHATSISTLNVCAALNKDVPGGCSTGPYGTVTLTPDGVNAVDVTVKLDTGFFFTDSGGAGKALLFSLSGLNDVIGTPTEAQLANDIANLTPGFVIDTQSPVAGDFVHAAGSNSFEFAIECGDGLTVNNVPHLPCPGGAAGSVQDATTFSFTLNNATVGSFVTNKDGFLFESSVFSPTAASDEGGTGGTGEVTSTTLTTVPEPSTLLLLATGMLGAVRFASRRRRA